MTAGPPVVVADVLKVSPTVLLLADGVVAAVGVDPAGRVSACAKEKLPLA